MSAAYYGQLCQDMNPRDTPTNPNTNHNPNAYPNSNHNLIRGFLYRGILTGCRYVRRQSVSQ